MNTSTPTPEETLEEKLDRLNLALKNTVQSLDNSFISKRIPSPSSFLNSKATSFCLSEAFEQENRSIQIFEENIENMLRTLDRSQMQSEDFWSDAVRSEEKQEKFKIIENSKKISAEKRLIDLETLLKSLSDEQNTLKDLGDKLKFKEIQLNKREKKVKELEKKFKNNEIFESDTKKHDDFLQNNGRYLDILQEINFNRDEQSQSDLIVQELRNKVKMLEELLGETRNSLERTKILKEIATAKNQIHIIRAELVLKACAKGKENPGNLKISDKLEVQKNRENISFTPSNFTRSLKRFAF
jgi:hypothetical protein